MQTQLPRLEFCQDTRINTFVKCAMKSFVKSSWKLVFKKRHPKGKRNRTAGNHGTSLEIFQHQPCPGLTCDGISPSRLALQRNTLCYNPGFLLQVISSHKEERVSTLHIFLIKCFPLPPIPLQTSRNKKHI